MGGRVIAAANSLSERESGSSSSPGTESGVTETESGADTTRCPERPAKQRRQIHLSGSAGKRRKMAWITRTRDTLTARARQPRATPLLRAPANSARHPYCARPTPTPTARARQPAARDTRHSHCARPPATRDTPSARARHQ